MKLKREECQVLHVRWKNVMWRYWLSGTCLKGPGGYSEYQAEHEQKCAANMKKIKCILGYTSSSEAST